MGKFCGFEVLELILPNSINALFSRLELKIKRDLLRVSGFRCKENYHLNSPVSEGRKDVDRISIYSPSTSFSRRSLTESDDCVTYSFPRRYVYRIPGAIIDPVNNIVYDQHGKLIAESSSWPTLRLLYEVPRPFVNIPKKKLVGEYLFYSVTPNYYHWLLEDFPAFLGSLQFLNDHIRIIKSKKISFGPAEFVSREFHNNICAIEGLVQVENLIMTAKTSGLGVPFSHNALHPIDVRLAKKWMLEKYRNKIPPSRHEKIYVSRVGISRSPHGEQILVDILAKKGFYIFDGKASLLEQISLFQGCKLLVGASGAALSNILWMRDDSKVLKLDLEGERFHFFYDLAEYNNVQMTSIKIPADGIDESVLSTIFNRIKDLE